MFDGMSQGRSNRMGRVNVAGLLVFELDEVTERRIPDLNIGFGVPFGVVDRTRVARIGTDGVEHTETSRRWENVTVGEVGHGTIPWLRAIMRLEIGVRCVCGIVGKDLSLWAL
ncbi:hypothetical protein PsorP6_016444 [Peronosclerospora sorghi]|uniref:Uncharacterized protein n=1 Tax=Peronosclerospora sorghi TaxID=230839 RepID=A0ACC0VKM4_9STRA|nr:hypothetical protein PsorP6_016444 [Peronosclerospora sorghi]